MPDRRAGPAGLLLALTSAAAFGSSGVFATGLIGSGWSPGAAVTARVGVGALVLTVPALLALRGRWSLLRSNLRLVLAVGLFAVAGCQLAYFLAVERVSVGVAVLLQYSGVVVVVLWTWLRHGQRPSAVTAAGVVGAVVGLLLVLDLLGGARVDPLGVTWGLLSAVGLAVYYLVSARSDGALPPLVTAWGGLAVGATVLGAAALVGLVPWRSGTADVELAGRTLSWVVPVLGLSLVAAALSYAAGIAAIRRLGSRLASFVGLTEVLFAVLLAALALGQVPGPAQLVGGLVVLAGIVAVRVGEGPAVDVDPVPPP